MDFLENLLDVSPYKVIILQFKDELQKMLNSPQISTRRKARLFIENPFCYYCHRMMKVQMYLERHKKQPADLATIEHLRSKLHPLRLHAKVDPLWEEKKGRTVLACAACNCRRGTIENSKLTKEEKWKRSKRYPQNMEHQKKRSNEV